MVITGTRPLEVGLIFGILIGEGSGVICHDISGNGHHATLTNAGMWEAGPQMAVDQSAGEDCDFGNHADFNPAVGSIALKVYVDPADVQGHDWARVIDMGNGIRMWFATSVDRLAFTPRMVGGVKTINGPSGIGAGWYIVVGIVGATGNSFYIDGDFIGSMSWGADTINYANTNAKLGAALKAKYQWAFAWDRELSHEDVRLLYAQRRRQ